MVSADHFDGVEIERPRFRRFDARIEVADHRAAGHVAFDHEVVSRGGDEGVGRHLNVFRRPQQADLDGRLGHDLAEEIAAEVAADIVDGDGLVACDERGSETLLGLLFGLSERDH